MMYSTYRHAEGFAASELKHVSIALIDNGTTVVAIVQEENKISR